MPHTVTPKDQRVAQKMAQVTIDLLDLVVAHDPRDQTPVCPDFRVCENV